MYRPGRYIWYNAEKRSRNEGTMSIELGINCNQDLKRETDDVTAYKADPLLPPMYRFVN